MPRVVGILHNCIKDGRKKFFNPSKFTECPACGEDMTNKLMKIYDVCRSSKDPFTERHVEEAKKIIMGRIETTTPNSVWLVTSARISSEEIQRLEWLGFEKIDILANSDFATNVICYWNKELPAECVKEGTPI